MIQIKDLKVCSLDLNFHEVSWAVEDNAESAFDYAFQVLRSESAMGPFEPISISFEDRYVFVDNILQIAATRKTSARPRRSPLPTCTRSRSGGTFSCSFTSTPAGAAGSSRCGPSVNGALTPGTRTSRS